MSSDPSNPLGDRRKAQEEEYFNKQNQEAAARLKAKTELEKVGIKDTDLVDKLGKAGFDGDSARALFLIPLIDVVWADGKAQFEEKKLIEELTAARGLTEGSKAKALIDLWMSKKPTDQAFRVGLELLGPILKDSRDENPGVTSWVLESSKRVAEATGSLFGFKKISDQEEAALKRLTEKLN